MDETSGWLNRRRLSFGRVRRELSKVSFLHHPTKSEVNVCSFERACASCFWRLLSYGIETHALTYDGGGGVGWRRRFSRDLDANASSLTHVAALRIRLPRRVPACP